MTASVSQVHTDKEKRPRPYLSWSQFSCFEYSRAQYISRYLMGKQISSPELELGKNIASGLEADESSDPGTELVRLLMPSYAHREYEIEFTFKGIPILVKMDCFDPAPLRIGEVKTGHKPWTQKRVDEHG